MVSFTRRRAHLLISQLYFSHTALKNGLSSRSHPPTRVLIARAHTNITHTHTPPAPTHIVLDLQRNSLADRAVLLRRGRRRTGVLRSRLYMPAPRRPRRAREAAAGREGGGAAEPSRRGTFRLGRAWADVWPAVGRRLRFFCASWSSTVQYSHTVHEKTQNHRIPQNRQCMHRHSIYAHDRSY